MSVTCVQWHEHNIVFIIFQMSHGVFSHLWCLVSLNEKLVHFSPWCSSSVNTEITFRCGKPTTPRCGVNIIRLPSEPTTSCTLQVWAKKLPVVTFAHHPLQSKGPCRLASSREMNASSPIIPNTAPFPVSTFVAPAPNTSGEWDRLNILTWFLGL